MISNPLVADVELSTDQPNSRLLNLYGKTFGTTSLTMWDQTNRPVSFLVRVSLDTKDLASRIRQAFPGADVKVRQVGPQIILDGQVPDSKTMSDIIQLVTFTLMTSPSLRVLERRRRRRRDGGGGRRWQRAAVARAAAAAARGAMIINRITVPGPRQVLLHVKIAEINRSATRTLGVSWLYARGNSLIGSVAGNNATDRHDGQPRPTPRLPTPLGFVKPIQGTFGGTATATPGRQLTAVRRVRRRPLFACSSTPFAPTTSRRSSPSPTWSPSTDNPPGSWSEGCSRSRFPRARRSRAERPW